MSDSAEIEQLLQQAKENGISVASVADGTVFTFTKGMLEELLERASKSGKVAVFVRHGTPKKVPTGPDIDLGDFDLTGGVLN